jgi:hypothetical protein
VKVALERVIARVKQLVQEKKAVENAAPAQPTTIDAAPVTIIAESHEAPAEKQPPTIVEESPSVKDWSAFERISGQQPQEAASVAETPEPPPDVRRRAKAADTKEPLAAPGPLATPEQTEEQRRIAESIIDGPAFEGAALRKLAVRVDIEAQPPKPEPLIDAINAALSDPRRLGKS